MGIPTLFTFLNLFSGFMAIVSISELRIDQAFWFIIFSAIFDFLDGKVARFLRVTSRIGPQVDSLADAISFGVAPSFLIYNLISSLSSRLSPFHLLPFLYLSTVIMRLARFNVIGEESQKSYYLGLSSPISAIFLVSFITTLEKLLPAFVFLREVVGAVVVALSLLMVSKIEFPVFKGSRRTEKFQILFFVIGLLFLILWKGVFLLAISGLYILFSIILSLFRREDEQ